MSKLSIMGSNGHTEVSWDVADSATVAEARKTFEEYVNLKGYTAFMTTAPTTEAPPVGGATTQHPSDRTEQIKDFHPEAEEVILVPRIAGGCS